MTSQDQSGKCPMSAVAGHATTYNDYLKIDQLLKLQYPLSEPAHHDEMLFIVIHQAYELWFKLILHELENAIYYMAQKKVLRAQHFLNRSVKIMNLLVQQIHILETMTPQEFLEFRDYLTPASGFQSTQFREIEFLLGLRDESYLGYFHNRPDFLDRLRTRMESPTLWGAYCQMLTDQGFAVPETAFDSRADLNDSDRRKVFDALLPIYRSTSDYLDFYMLTESMVDLDEQLGLWRQHHVRVVERIIGFKPGTGGSSGVGYLESTTKKKCFPLLWELRTVLNTNTKVNS